MSSTEGSRTGVRWRTDELLDAAVLVFGERGYQAATMNTITQRSTATKATFYSRFGSKDDLYAACLHREAERMRAHLVTAYGSADTLSVSQQLEVDMLAFFHYAATNPAGFALLFGPEAAGPAARIRQTLLNAIHDEVAQRVRRTLTTRNPHAVPSADMIAAMIIGVAVHGTYQAVVVEQTSPERAGATAGSFVIAALRNMDTEALLDTAHGYAPTAVSPGNPQQSPTNDTGPC